ncbi:insulin-like growth factor-binding protein 7 [Ornithorhynchus anatinus]|uniref:Insulin-like growth factor-binding protein 7 n=1 Tax=Ornithorhynchus anatinus TaxID=9258 RepID=A0A6I8PD55_ORNAN|nr:insulin-like growth factor-binding protein 7 [Ornithorhynchus anatinus]
MAGSPGRRRAGSWPVPPVPPAPLLLPLLLLLLLLPPLVPLASGSAGESSEASAGPGPACGPCRPAACPPLPAPGCPLGETRDACGCCPVCTRGEGEPCGGGGAGRGHCAPGLECLKSRKRRKGKAGAAAAAAAGAGPGAGPGAAAGAGVCVCKAAYPVCGSDGLTYPSGCQLRAASLRAQSRGEKPVSQLSKGTCEQGASIVTPPKDIWNVTGAQVYLSCEVIGIPTPVLIWNKVKRGQFGVQRTELLPGDRDNLAIQTRGGPEKHEVTGWVLISPLNKEDEGEYECHASNSQGQAAAAAKITVVNSLQELPVKKEEDAEL